MPNPQYAEEQKTPWFSGVELPIRPGRYEVRMRNSQDIIDGTFAGGRWRLEFDGYAPISPTSLRTFEWRGLNAEPKNEPRTRWTEMVASHGEVTFL